MSDSTPAASPATPPSMEKVAFPFGGLWSIAFTIMAFFAVYNAWRDWQFYQIKEPVVVKSADDARALTANQLVEVHIPLDLDAGIAFEFRGGDKFIAAPFEGTEKRLIFATQGELTADRVKDFIPPMRGRSGTKDISDKWEIGDDKSVKLEKVFGEKVPDDAIVIRTDTATAVPTKVWIGAGIGVLFLLFKLYQTFLWATGAVRPVTPEAPAAPTTPA